MPFRIQCPYCRCFMLVDDAYRDASTTCLLCKRPIELHGTSARETTTSRWRQPDAPAPTRPPTTPANETVTAQPAVVPSEPDNAPGKVRVRCPACQTRMRLPATGKQHAVKCPGCSHTFPAQC